MENKRLPPIAWKSKSMKLRPETYETVECIKKEMRFTDNEVIEYMLIYGS